MKGIDMYQIEDIIGKVHNCDCLEFMKHLPDKCIDLVLTSPPYNMGGKSLGGHTDIKSKGTFYGDEYNDNMNDKEYTEWIISLISQSLIKSRYVFWNMQYVVSTKTTIHNIFKTYDNNMKDIFIWKKQAVAQICVNHSPILANGFEFIFMLGQDNTKIFKYSNFPQNGYVPNIKDWYKKDIIQEHHATYPLDMCIYFIEYFTKPNDIILDPFLGSGTTAIACERLGRKWIGCEISQKYCAIANKRIEAERAQLKLSF